jgi:signal transduction histidine kinase
MDREIRELTGVLLLLVGPGLVIAGLGGALLTNRALLPVRRITEAAGRMEAEDLSRRFPVNGRDELSTLSFTFNGMLARLEKAFHEQEEASAELERANRHLKQVNELQRRFTGDASHELKTPLTVIQGTVSLTLSSPRTQKQYEQALHTVGHAADTMIKIVRDLLLLARSDAGLLEMNKHRAKLWEIVQVAAESVATAEPSAKINILVDHDIAIVCDPDHLTRLFMNLMDNAQRYTPADGSITVAAQRQEGSLSVTVADTGSGIPPEHLAHVFDRFYRVDAARSDAEGGTGLGLAICRSIVEAHGGSISISSKLGHGTLVEMRFPL